MLVQGPRATKNFNGAKDKVWQKHERGMAVGGRGPVGERNCGRREIAFKRVGQAPEMAARYLAWRGDGPAGDGGSTQVVV